MRVFIHIQVVTLLLWSVSVWAGHPNDSIVPEHVLPTPYGLTIERIVASQPVEKSDPVLIPPGAVDQHLRHLLDAELSGGAYSDELAETLIDLGRASQSRHKHAKAIAYFKRGLHLMRINEGLYSANQLPVLEAMIESQMLLGRLAKVDETRSYRYRAQKRVYPLGGRKFLQATLEYSEWQRQAYLAELGANTYKRLLNIHTMHSRSIEYIEQKNEHDPAMIPILYQRMRAEYLLAQYTGEPLPLLQVSANIAGVANGPNTNLAMEEFRQLRKNNFRNGRKSLQRIVTLLEKAEPLDVEQLALAKVALGDWYMWWNLKSRALHSYEDAYALQAADGRSITESLALFTEPVELPVEKVFRPGPFTPDTSGRARATVRFDVSHLGQVREIQLIELEPENSMGARVTLFHMLRALRFRPLVKDGEIASAHGILREYKFDY